MYLSAVINTTEELVRCEAERGSNRFYFLDSMFILDIRESILYALL